MNRFCVYVNKNKPSQNNVPYLLNVQADALQKLQTVVCIPLIRQSESTQLSLLNPLIEIDRDHFVAMTQAIAAIPKQQLGKQVKDCNHESHAIVNALDFLLSGF